MNKQLLSAFFILLFSFVSKVSFAQNQNANTPLTHQDSLAKLVCLTAESTEQQIMYDKGRS